MYTHIYVYIYIYTYIYIYIYIYVDVYSRPGYLAHKKMVPPRTLQKSYAKALGLSRGGGRFLMSEVPLYLFGRARGVLERGGGLRSKGFAQPGLSQLLDCCPLIGLGGAPREQKMDTYPEPYITDYTSVHEEQHATRQQFRHVLSRISSHRKYLSTS